MSNWFKNIGPGALVAAAFIGPGTVTVCTLAGVKFGYELLWALLISIIATIVLQEMAARLGIVSQKGLSAVIREQIQSPVVKVIALFLILGAIVVGNAAYEAGNISGGVLGMETLLANNATNTTASFNVFSIAIGVLAFVILFIGNYKILERALVSLVALMSVAFVVTAFMTKPDLMAMLKGFLVPNIDSEKLLTIIGLVGTTVVPYNLFLHASLVKERWQNVSDLGAARKDTIISITLGGIVSLAIIVCAAAVQGTEVNNAAGLATSLEPLLGSYAKYFLALGLFAAGLTSAITRFRLVWIFILFLGVGFSSLGIKSIEIIRFAQITNGLLLPIIAVFLLWTMNRSAVLGEYVNTKTQNAIGMLIVLFSLFLGAKSLAKVFGLY